MILIRGGTNGKFIRSGRAVEERTRKSTTGSPTVYCRTRGFGKLGLEPAAHVVRLGSEANQPCTESTVGTGEGPSASGETHANNFGGRQKEDRSCRTCSLGEVQSGKEEGCLGPLEPAASVRQAFPSSASRNLSRKLFVSQSLNGIQA